MFKFQYFALPMKILKIQIVNSNAIKEASTKGH